jgi:hypothetical protein
MDILQRYPNILVFTAQEESPSYNAQTYSHTNTLIALARQVMIFAELIYNNGELFEYNLHTWAQLEQFMSVMNLYARLLHVMATSCADPITVKVLNTLCDDNYFPPSHTSPVLHWLFPLHNVVDMYRWVNQLRPPLTMPSLRAVMCVAHLDFQYRLPYFETHVPVVPEGGSGSSDDSDSSDDHNDNDDFDLRKTQLTTTTETNVQRPSTSGTTDTSAKRKADLTSSEQESRLDRDDPKRSRNTNEADEKTTSTGVSKEKESITIIDLCEPQNCVFHTMKYMMDYEANSRKLTDQQLTEEKNKVVDFIKEASNTTQQEGRRWQVLTNDERRLLFRPHPDLVLMQDRDY